MEKMFDKCCDISLHIMFWDIARANQEHGCYFHRDVMQLYVVKCVKDWETFKSIGYYGIVGYCPQCETKKHLDESLLTAIRQDNEIFFRMLMQIKEFHALITLDLQQIAIEIVKSCKFPLKFKKIFETWHDFRNKVVRRQWESYFIE